EIGLVLLIPVVMLAIHRSRKAAMYLAIPALAGLSVLHGFIPPHPGPLAAIANLDGRVGITLALGLLISVPTVIIAGPLFAMLAARWVPIGARRAGGRLRTADQEAAECGPSGDAATPDNAGAAGRTSAGEQHERPLTPPAGFVSALATIRRPVVLMLLRAGADVWMSE